MNSEASANLTPEHQTEAHLRTRQLLSGELADLKTIVLEEANKRSEKYRLALANGEDIDRILIEMLIEQLQETIGY
jgi:hypothetical protein